jgi:hypothetical protein
MKHIIIFLLIILGTGFVSAQENEKPKKKKTIFELLNTSDSTSGAKVVVIQDKRLESVISERKAGTQTVVASGYRVQVFSSNTQRTAKNEAYKIEKEMREIFPEHAVYVNYSAPFWKVRIGDFKTMNEAQELRAEILKLFPSLRSDTYTVRDQVNL